MVTEGLLDEVKLGQRERMITSAFTYMQNEEWCSTIQESRGCLRFRMYTLSTLRNHHTGFPFCERPDANKEGGGIQVLLYQEPFTGSVLMIFGVTTHTYKHLVALPSNRGLGLLDTRAQLLSPDQI